MMFLTKKQENLRHNLRDFAESRFSQGAAFRAKQDRVLPKVIQVLAESGYLGMTTPEKYGGNPLDGISIGLVFEEICGVDWSPMSLMLSHVLAPLMLEQADEALQAEWLPKLAAGDKLICFGNTEPDCGSDAAAIRTGAVRDGDDYIISGEKTSISGGIQADAIVMTAKTDPQAGARGVTCFFVPLDLPGVDRSHFDDLGSIPACRASVHLSNVRVPKRYRIGLEGQGFTKVMKGFDFGRVLVVLAGLGLTRASLEETTQYVGGSRVNNLPLAEFQSVSFKLAEAATYLEAVKLLCYQVLKLRDEGQDHAKESAMAKWFGARYCTEAMHRVLLTLGPMGYSQVQPFEQRFRDVFGLKLGDGTEEIMKLIVSREIMKPGPQSRA